MPLRQLRFHLGVYLAVSQGLKRFGNAGWGIDTNLSVELRLESPNGCWCHWLLGKWVTVLETSLFGRYNPTTGRRNQSGFNRLRNS